MYALLARSDAEFHSLIADLIQHDTVRQLAAITHHHFTNRLDHSISVAYLGYRLAKKWGLNYRSVARAGLLHDCFLESREEIATMNRGSHSRLHPLLACENAAAITTLSHMEQDIIKTHMFLVSRCAFPRYKESYLITFVDKYIAMKEVAIPLWNRVRIAWSNR